MGGSVFFLVPLAGGSAVAQEVDLTALVHETQKLSAQSGTMTMAWWIPEQFWTANFRQQSLPVAQVEEFLRVVRPYTIVAVCDGTVGPRGEISYHSQDVIRTNLQLIDARGKSYLPRTEDEFGGEIKNLLAMMKPILTGMLGPMGQNLHFFLFPATTAGRLPVADAAAMGHFQVRLGEREFAWRLPLDAVLPGQVCPDCHEPCKGSWNYCPWCGTKLA